MKELICLSLNLAPGLLFTTPASKSSTTCTKKPFQSHFSSLSATRSVQVDNGGPAVASSTSATV